MRLPGPHLRGAVHLARRPRLGDPRARVGDRPRRPHRRDASGRAAHRRRARCRSAIRATIRSGRACRRPGITVVAHAGDSGYSSNGYAVDGFAAGFSGGGRWAPSIKAFAHRARRVRLPDHARVRQALRAVPGRAHRVGRERIRVPPRPVQEAALDRPQDARLLHAKIRSSRSGATCGSTRSGKTTSTRSSTSWAPTA